jgi:predicted lipoprotein with Yx(FWY)xxD motif
VVSPCPPAVGTERSALALRLSGGGLLIATAAIHLDLYLTGYRSIPVIGWLFLLQIIAAFALGGAVVVSGGRLAAAAGAVFALATLGGYLLSLWAGLFGFTEVRTTAGIVAGVIDVASFAVLGALAVQSAERGRAHSGLAARPWPRVPGTGRGDAAVFAVSAAALAVLGTSLAIAAAPAAAAGGTLTTVRVGGVTVLAAADGRTLYWFTPDTVTRSACYGTCAAYWPPVTGPVTAGPGIPGRLATIMRTDGSVQAVYDGHPLYTYIGDSAPGQANGNGLNLNGGLWHELPAAG